MSLYLESLKVLASDGTNTHAILLKTLTMYLIRSAGKSKTFLSLNEC